MMPFCLVMRGEDEFLSSDCVRGWKGGGMFNRKFVSERVLGGCLHHGLLEDGKTYSDVVQSFISNYN